MIFKRVKPKDYNLQFTDLTPRMIPAALLSTIPAIP